MDGPHPGEGRLSLGDAAHHTDREARCEHRARQPRQCRDVGGADRPEILAAVREPARRLHDVRRAIHNAHHRRAPAMSQTGPRAGASIGSLAFQSSRMVLKGIHRFATGSKTTTALHERPPPSEGRKVRPTPVEWGVLAAEHRGAGRAAQRCRDHRVRISDSSVDEEVLQLRHAPEGVPALVVRQDDDDVRWSSLRLRRGACLDRQHEGQQGRRAEDGLPSRVAHRVNLAYGGAHACTCRQPAPQPRNKGRLDRVRDTHGWIPAFGGLIVRDARGTQPHRSPPRRATPPSPAWCPDRCLPRRTRSSWTRWR